MNLQDKKYPFSATQIFYLMNLITRKFNAYIIRGRKKEVYMNSKTQKDHSFKIEDGKLE